MVERSVKIEACTERLDLRSHGTMRMVSYEADLDLGSRKQARLASETDYLMLQGHTNVTLCSDTTKVEVFAPNEISMITPAPGTGSHLLPIRRRRH